MAYDDDLFSDQGRLRRRPRVAAGGDVRARKCWSPRSIVRAAHAWSVAAFRRSTWSMPAEFARSLHNMKGYGWSVENASYDHNLFMDRMHREIDRLSGIYARNLRNAGAETDR